MIKRRPRLGAHFESGAARNNHTPARRVTAHDSAFGTLTQIVTPDLDLTALPDVLSLRPHALSVGLTEPLGGPQSGSQARGAFAPLHEGR